MMWWASLKDSPELRGLQERVKSGPVTLSFKEVISFAKRKPIIDLDMIILVTDVRRNSPTIGSSRIKWESQEVEFAPNSLGDAEDERVPRVQNYRI